MEYRNIGWAWVDYGETAATIAESYDDLESGRGVTIEKEDLINLLKGWPDV